MTHRNKTYEGNCVGRTDTGKRTCKVAAAVEKTGEHAKESFNESHKIFKPACMW